MNSGEYEFILYNGHISRTKANARKMTHDCDMVLEQIFTTLSTMSKHFFSHVFFKFYFIFFQMIHLT